jgi:hypothetical protein
MSTPSNPAEKISPTKRISCKQLQSNLDFYDPVSDSAETSNQTCCCDPLSRILEEMAIRPEP